MYHIAICDDDERELENLQIFFNLYHAQKPEMDFTVKSFVNPDDLLKKVEGK